MDYEIDDLFSLRNGWSPGKFNRCLFVQWLSGHFRSFIREFAMIKIAGYNYLKCVLKTFLVFVEKTSN